MTDRQVRHLPKMPGPFTIGGGRFSARLPSTQFFRAHDRNRYICDFSHNKSDPYLEARPADDRGKPNSDRSPLYGNFSRTKVLASLA